MRTGTRNWKELDREGRGNIIHKIMELGKSVCVEELNGVDGGRDSEFIFEVLIFPPQTLGCWVPLTIHYHIINSFQPTWRTFSQSSARPIASAAFWRASFGFQSCQSGHKPKNEKRKGILCCTLIKHWQRFLLRIPFHSNAHIHEFGQGGWFYRFLFYNFCPVYIHTHIVMPSIHSFHLPSEGKVNNGWVHSQRDPSQTGKHRGII